MAMMVVVNKVMKKIEDYDRDLTNHNWFTKSAVETDSIDSHD